VGQASPAPSASASSAGSLPTGSGFSLLVVISVPSPAQFTHFTYIVHYIYIVD
jgi:hypothetical protein